MKVIGVLRISILGAVLAFVMQACGRSGPAPINYGHEQCSHCRMTVSDPHFGSQLITHKGRVYTFDDAQCLVAFVKEGGVSEADVAGVYLSDYVNGNILLPAEGLFLLRSESLKSPMNGNIAAFSTAEDRAAIKEIHGGDELNWADVLK